MVGSYLPRYFTTLTLEGDSIVSIERRMFSIEENKARSAILRTHEGTKAEYVNQWLDQWWDAKRPLIEAFNGLYLFGWEGLEGEESTERDTDSVAKGQLINLMGEKLFDFTAQEHRNDNRVLPLMKYILIDKKFIPNRLDFFNQVHNNKRLQAREVIDPDGRGWCWNLSGSTGEPHDHAVIANADNAGAWDVMCYNFRSVKEKYRDVVFLNYDEEIQQEGTTYIRRNAALDQHFQGVRLYRLLEVVIQNTPLELLLDNKTNTGMKLTKFLKTMYPDEWIIFHYPQEDGKVRSFWEQFEILWSQVLQAYSKPEKTVLPSVVVSLSPIDYLMMSEATSWSSCHRFVNNMYVVGGASYAVDPITALAYSPRDRLNRYGVEFFDKRWRQVVHIDLANGSAVFGREYPSSHNALAKTCRSTVNYMLADYHKVTPTWIKSSGRGKVSGAGSKHIYVETNGPHTKLKAIMKEPEGHYGRNLNCFGCSRPLPLGERGRRNYTCGSCHRPYTGSVYRPYTRDWSTVGRQRFRTTDHTITECECCGENRRRYNIRLTPTGQSVCMQCIAKSNREDSIIFICPTCQRVEFKGNAEDYDGVYHCSECVTNMIEDDDHHEEFDYECDRCGAGIYEDDAYDMHDREGYWCEGCFDQHGAYCRGCDDRLAINNMEYIDSVSNEGWYCESCRDDLHYCDHCERYVDETNWYESLSLHVCDGCMETYYDLCEVCNSYCGVDDLEAMHREEQDDTVNACYYCRSRIHHENEQFQGRQAV